MRGPAIFLAQFISDQEPFNTLEGICRWAAQAGFQAIQLPTSSPEIFDLSLAATSRDYCDEIGDVVARSGLAITDLSTHLQGQLIAVHPAYDNLFDGFAPQEVRNDPPARQQWAAQQLILAADASANLGLTTHATFSGSLAWPYIYPWPQRPPGLIEEAFDELARRWLPILDRFDEVGVDLCYEIHPGEDLHDGDSFDMFLDKVRGHARANILYDPSHLLLQGLDYLAYIDIYRDRIKAFHVKDAELRPTGRSGVYGGYQSWENRAGRFRTPGWGQIDFRSIFSKLSQYGYSGWATLEWECPLQDAQQGAEEGAKFIQQHLFRKSARNFDDFAASSFSSDMARTELGLDRSNPA